MGSGGGGARPRRGGETSTRPPAGGDGNADGAIDISDALQVLVDLFLNPEPAGCLDGEDANDDGAVNLTDAVSILDYLFVGAPAPPAPGADCGFDPTPDTLVCGQTTGCS